MTTRASAVARRPAPVEARNRESPFAFHPFGVQRPRHAARRNAARAAIAAVTWGTCFVSQPGAILVRWSRTPERAAGRSAAAAHPARPAKVVTAAIWSAALSSAPLRPPRFPRSRPLRPAFADLALGRRSSIDRMVGRGSSNYWRGRRKRCKGITFSRPCAAFSPVKPARSVRSVVPRLAHRFPVSRDRRLASGSL